MRDYPCPNQVRCVVKQDRPPGEGHMNASKVVERIKSWHSDMVARHRSPRGCCGNDFLSYIINDAGIAWLERVACRRTRTIDCGVVWKEYLFNVTRIMKTVESLEELSTPHRKCHRFRECVLREEIDCSDVYFDIDDEDKELKIIRSVVKALYSDRH